MGTITHEGSAWRRWIHIQAAPKAVQGSIRFSPLYQRVSPHRRRQKAQVAVARELLVIIWHILHSHRPYQERVRQHR